MGNISTTPFFVGRFPSFAETLAPNCRKAAERDQRQCQRSGHWRYVASQGEGKSNHSSGREAGGRSPELPTPPTSGAEERLDLRKTVLRKEKVAFGLDRGGRRVVGPDALCAGEREGVFALVPDDESSTARVSLYPVGCRFGRDVGSDECRRRSGRRLSRFNG